ncbi:MAG TPA: carboxypeptidase-like regulatory domain-containing protein [Thermoanaerobaculia bacterium]|nr:carboxypeptidase-like regulatory domain-containing protein [Thermoanaerobaculia bacterium]
MTDRQRLAAPPVVALAALLLGAVLADASAAQGLGKKKPYADGEEVIITGKVTDPGGNPVPDLPVEIRASRESFSVRKMRKVEENPVTVRTRTDANGDYRIVWTWHHYYNRFLVQALIPVRLPDHMVQDTVVGQVDITGFIGNGSPVRAQFPLGNPALVQRVRDFEAAVDTADEHRVYGERGLPEKVESYEYPEHDEQSWWYFAQGTMYRFTDGSLIEIENFDPVTGSQPR